MISRYEVNRSVNGVLGILLLILAFFLIGVAVASEPAVCRVDYGAADGGSTRFPTWALDGGCRWYTYRGANDAVVVPTIVLMQCSTDVRFAVNAPLGDGGSALATTNDMMAQFAVVNDPVKVPLAPGERDIAVLNTASSDGGYCLFATARERKIW
jgi:hypothetical protein